jgi:hypothetical protein
MSELPPERPKESPKPMRLWDIISRKLVRGIIEDSQKEDEAARKLNANITDVKSEIAVLWETRKELVEPDEPDTPVADPDVINDVNQRLLDAQARLIELEPPETQ